MTGLTSKQVNKKKNQFNEKSQSHTMKLLEQVGIDAKNKVKPIATSDVCKADARKWGPGCPSTALRPAGKYERM